MRANGYSFYFGAQFDSALGTAVTRFVDMISEVGILGVTLIAFNYLFLYGTVVVLSYICFRLLYWSRAACFYVISVAVLTAATFVTENPYPSSPALISACAAPGRARDLWIMYLVQYPAFALPVAILIGAIGAALPIWKPAERYWLKRGLCPKCEYDLRGKIDAGCPECGWNRPAVSFDEMAERNGEG